MGREIRRVPPDWEHPRDNKGHRQPLHDSVYEDVAREWLAQARAWDVGAHPDQLRDPEETGKYRFYWEWHGGPPEPEYYRQRRWTEAEATHFQIYETVTEGTPVSPVLPSREAVADWLISQGYSREAAGGFARMGWAPSLMISGGVMYRDIESAVLTDKDGED